MRLTAVLTATAALGLLGVGVQAGAKDAVEKSKARVQGRYYPATRFDVSRPLSDLIAERQKNQPAAGEAVEREAVPNLPVRRLGNDTGATDGAIDAGRRTPSVLPTPIANFEGVSDLDNFNVLGGRVLPPDTNGAVGPSHYVQTVNLLFRIYSKTGTPLTPAAPISALFSGFGGPCAVTDDGDPIVLYDELADRWLISQFVFAIPSSECVAISTSGDPTGSYYRYEFVTPNANFQDYPHIGVWPDAYYMTANQFFNASSFNGTGVWAYDRVKMIAGNPAAGAFYVDLNITDFPEFIGGTLPADLDGPPPAPGTPNYIIYPLADEFGDALDALRVFEFAVDFAGGNASLSEVAESPIPVAAYTPQTGGRNAIPQPAPATSTTFIDMIGDRLMHRLQYRNYGSYSSLVMNHSVDIDPSASVQGGVRYYQLKNTSGTWTINEQATYAPADTNSRWMGSAAMDASGNLAVGFSVSGLSTFPSIRYAARLAADPPNGLHQGEQNIVAGGWVQLSTSNRWGDYSALDVDPTDDCTFWYTTEYYAADDPSTTAEWQTRIASFKLPGCTAIPKGTLTGTVKNAATAAAISGANINASGYIGTTNGSGVYSISAGAGTYDVTASAAGYLPATATGVAVTAGNTTTQDFLLTGVPVLSIASVTFSDAGGNNNGQIDANECITVNVTLNNTGGAAATSITGNFLTTTPDVGTGPHAAWANIAAGSSGVNLTPFKISTLPTFSAFAINLTLVVTTKSGTFSLPVTLPASGGGVIFNSTDTPIAIPDNNTTGITSTITISGYTSTISDVNVSLHITHTWDGDVNVRLTAPNNTTALLINGGSDIGGSGDGFGSSCSARTTLDDEATTAIASGTAPFEGSFTPSNPLSVFDGVSGANVNSGWKLKVHDDFSGDTGTLQCWSMIVSPGTPGSGVCVPTTPEITAPLGGTKLTSDSAIFTWTAGGQTGILEYWLRIGSTPGAFDIYPGANADGSERDGSQGLNTSKTVKQLPIDGRVIYAQLWYRLAAPGGWNLAPGIFAYSTITATKGLILTPPDGSTLTAGGETFTWTPGEGVQAFWLYIGTAPGLNNRYDSGMLPGSQTSLSGVTVLETGETVYASLFSYLPQLGWSKADTKSYTAPNTLASMITPVPGSSISGNVTFTWTASPTGTMYWLGVGTTEAAALSGTGALYYAGTAGTTVTVNGLPGTTLYVKLWTFLPVLGWQAPMSYTYNCLGLCGAGCASPGTMAAGDPTQTDRLFRDGVPSDCPGKAFPGTFSSGTQLFKTLNIVNSNAVPVCASITHNGGTCGTGTFTSAYSGSYNPASMSTNYLGDAGSSPSAGQPLAFFVTIGAGQTLVVVTTTTGGAPASPCTYSIAAELCP